MFKKVILASLFSLISVTPSFALVMGGSNLSIMGYPQYEHYTSGYNMSYSDMQNMKYDVSEYVDKCNNDIQRIIEARNNAIDEYNRTVQEYNTKNY